MGSAVTITPDAPASAVTITPDAPSSAQKEGFGGALWNDVKGMATTAFRNANGFISNPGATLYDMGSAVYHNLASIPASDKERSAAGYSLPYRAAAAIGQGTGVVDPSSMEAAAKAGDPGAVLGHAALPAAMAVAPLGTEALGKVTGAVGDIAQTEARRMYQSALKPPPGSNSASDVAKMVSTGLSNEIPVSASGAVKLKALVSDLNNKIAAEIQAGSQQGVTVNKFDVAQRLGSTANRFATQVNPEADLTAIGNSGNEFLRNQPNEIPASAAQKIKQGTYQQLSDKAYGELTSATEESQKALARGLKEELQKAFPEIGDLNASESQLLGLQPSLERAVRRIDNHQLLGIGTPITAGAVGAVTGSGPVGIAAGIMKAALDDPMLKSKIAIILNRASQGAQPFSASQARVGLYANSLARVANAQGSAAQSGQQQPAQ